MRWLQPYIRIGFSVVILLYAGCHVFFFSPTYSILYRTSGSSWPLSIIQSYFKSDPLWRQDLCLTVCKEWEAPWEIIHILSQKQHHYLTYTPLMHKQYYTLSHTLLLSLVRTTIHFYKHCYISLSHVLLYSHIHYYRVYSLRYTTILSYKNCYTLSHTQLYFLTHTYKTGIVVFVYMWDNDAVCETKHELFSRDLS